jgi:hypothetical protein
MSKKILGLIFVLVNLNCFGQKDNVPEFIFKVYSDIFSSMTNGKIKKPSLQIISDSNKIIYFNPDANTIFFSEKFTRVMRSFNTDSMNAVAHVLSHELAHLILQQGDFLKIGSGYADSDFNEKLKNYQGQLKDSLAFFERQADENAIFYAHISGYQTTHVGSKVLNKIYSSFNLRDRKLKNYPELSERISIIEAASNRMKVLMKIYDFGIISILKGQFDQAIFFLDLIRTEKFFSKEIFNNLGAAYLMKAKLMLKDQFPFELPFQIDCYSYLNQQRDSKEDVKDLLLSAKECFDAAIQMDNYYYYSLLNNIIREYLSGVDCIKIQKKIELLNFDFNNFSDHWVLFAICEYSQGKQEEAIIRLQKIINVNVVAQKILCQLNPEKCSNTKISDFSVTLPQINISNDTTYKKRGESFRDQLKYIPQLSDKRLKINIYEDQLNKFYNFSVSGIPSFTISEIDLSYSSSYFNYNKDLFNGWINFESNGVIYVSNKKVVLKYLNNKLTNLYNL